MLIWSPSPFQYGMEDGSSLNNSSMSSDVGGFFGRSTPRHEPQLVQQALASIRQGIPLRQISKTLRIPLRTLSRWRLKDRNNKSSNEMTGFDLPVFETGQLSDIPPLQGEPPQTHQASSLDISHLMPQDTSLSMQPMTSQSMTSQQMTSYSPSTSSKSTLSQAQEAIIDDFTNFMDS